MRSGMRSRDRRKAIVVEFIGMPGSGKTFLTRAICEALRQSGAETLDFSRGTAIRRFSREWLWDHAALRSWVLRHPLSTYRLLQMIRSSGQPTRSAEKRFFWGWIKTLVRLANVRWTTDVILMDQGFLQAIWAIGYEATPARWKHVRSQLIALIPPPDVVIHVSAPDATVVSRLMRREGARSRVERDDPEQPETIRKARQLTGQLVSALPPAQRSWSNTVLIDVDNGADRCCRRAVENIFRELAQLRSREVGPRLEVDTQTGDWAPKSQSGIVPPQSPSAVRCGARSDRDQASE